MSGKPYYEADGITLYHGDCREILPYVDVVDLVLTDPPYGIGFVADLTTSQRKRITKDTWDNSPIDSDLMALVLSKGQRQVVWGGNYYPLPPSRGWLAWTKPDAVPSMSSVEFAWTSMDRPARHISHSIAATNAERVNHPTQKPLSVMLWCLSLFPTVESIIDPFAGSGTTLRAAKDKGLRAIGIERVEQYCEIAAQRLEQGVLSLGGAA